MISLMNVSREKMESRKSRGNKVFIPFLKSLLQPFASATKQI